MTADENDTIENGGDAGAAEQAQPTEESTQSAGVATMARTGSGGAEPVEHTPGAEGAGAGQNTAAQNTGAQNTAAPADGKARSSGGALGGALGFVSAGLGIVSLTGMTLGDMLRDHAQVVGQIQAGSGGGAGMDQVQALYGTPWHTAAMVNGIVGLVAAVLGVAVLAGAGARTDPRGWVKPLALGGLVLGVLGILVAAGMYLDLFAAPPQMPQMPQMPGGAGQ